MATVNDIIDRAYSRLGVLSEGRALSPLEKATALDAFNDMLDSLPDEGVGAFVGTQRVSGATTVTAPGILQVIASAAMTITLPKEPKDGFRVKIVDAGNNFATNNLTIARNGWLIAGAAADVTLSTNGQSKEYFFRADLGDWVAVTSPLTGTDTPHYSGRHTAGLAAMLAFRLADDSASAVSPQLSYSAQSGLTRLQAQYGPDLSADLGYAIRRSPSQIPIARTREMS